MKYACWLMLVVVSVWLAGCATASHPPLPPLTGDPVVDGQNAIQGGPPRDKVLWQYRIAAAEMRRGHYPEAKALLDDALARIANIFAPDKDAKKSRSYFASEAKKTFIGEPYERVMAYYYRGILYWMEGEPDNARACFRSAQIQDSDTEQKSYSSDYVLLEHLDGYVTTKLGGDGSDSWKRAQEVARIFRPPSYYPKANVFVFVEYGPGPVKFATGEYAEQLRFRCGAPRLRSAVVRVAEKTNSAPPYDDLCFQSTTRGGRVMDHILANKAVFKSGTDTAGNAAIIAGAILASQRNTQEAGWAALGVGVLAKVISASTTPAADTRSWDNLPMFLSFTALELPPGSHTATVEFLNEANQVVPTLTKTVTFEVLPGTSDKVIYVSDQSVTPLTL